MCIERKLVAEAAAITMPMEKKTTGGGRKAAATTVAMMSAKASTQNAQASPAGKADRKDFSLSPAIIAFIGREIQPEQSSTGIVMTFKRPRMEAAKAMMVIAAHRCSAAASLNFLAATLSGKVSEKNMSPAFRKTGAEFDISGWLRDVFARIVLRRGILSQPRKN